MASLRTFFSAIRAAPTCYCSPIHRRYSTPFPVNTNSKWQLGGYKPPRSLLDDDNSGSPIDLSEDDDAVNGKRPGTSPLHRRRPPKGATPSEYAAHRRAIQKAFPDGWKPPHRISREAMDGLRALHRADSATFTSRLLAEKFKISPEAVRRILKSRWEPPRERVAQLARRERAERAVRLRQAQMEEELQQQALLERAQSVGREVREDRSSNRFGVKDRLFFR